MHVNCHFESDYITAFNSCLNISNLIHNTWTPSSLGKLTLHITPGVLLVLFSPRIRGRTGSARSRSACCLMHVLWLHWHLHRLAYLLRQKLGSTAGERFADLPVMSYVEWFSRIGPVISKSHTLMSHSCLLWNCKIMFWASVRVTLFCVRLADRRHLCCPNTWQDENFTIIMLCARKVRAFSKTRPHLWHTLTTSRWGSPCLLRPKHSFWADQPAKYHLKGIPPEKLPETQVLGHLCPPVFVSPASKWCKRTASIVLLRSLLPAISCVWLTQQRYLEVCYLVLSVSLWKKSNKWLVLLQAETCAYFLYGIHESSASSHFPLQSLICIISV